jgi:hypothetical protein
MNSHKTLLITTIFLTFAILANVSVGTVYATGGLDDEEEEQAIEELQEGQEEITETLENINEFMISTPCGQKLATSENEEPVKQEPAKEEQQNNETFTSIPTVEAIPPEICNQQQEEQEQPEEQNNQTTVVPEVEPQQNVTEPEPQTQCPQPVEEVIPEPEPICNIETSLPEPQVNITEIVENITEELEPQLPFLPNLNISEPEQSQPEQEQQNQSSVIPEVETPQEAPQQCNVTSTEQPEQSQPVLENVTNTIEDGQEIAEIEFDQGCSCFVVDGEPEQSIATVEEELPALEEPSQQ